MLCSNICHTRIQLFWTKLKHWVSVHDSTMWGEIAIVPEIFTKLWGGNTGAIMLWVLNVTQLQGRAVHGIHDGAGDKVGDGLGSIPSTEKKDTFFSMNLYFYWQTKS